VLDLKRIPRNPAEEDESECARPSSSFSRGGSRLLLGGGSELEEGLGRSRDRRGGAAEAQRTAASPNGAVETGQEIESNRGQ
jgi:hypothetical protein